MKFTSIFFITCNILFFFRGNAQQSGDTSIYKASHDSVISLYQNRMNEKMQLYNGSQYSFIGHGVKGFPYFETDSPVVASISYNNILYYSVPVHYDIVKDVIFIKDYYQNFYIQPVPEKVDSFSFSNAVFIRLSNNDSNGILINPGFYQRLYNGHLVLYAKREKVESQNIDEGISGLKYFEYSTYYAEKNGIFYKIENEHILLDLLNDKKDALKKFIRENKLDFKKDFENSLIKTIAYY